MIACNSCKAEQPEEKQEWAVKVDVEIEDVPDFYLCIPCMEKMISDYHGGWATGECTHLYLVYFRYRAGG